jgi:competence protein ComEA
VLKYIFPNIPSFKENIEGEQVYEVEHKECPIPVEDTNPDCAIYVDVSGALNNPGVYCLPSGSLVIDAVKKAGGFDSQISIEYVERDINLAKPVTNNQKLYFPSKQELLCELKDFTLKVEDIIPPITESNDDSSTKDADNSQSDSGNTTEDSSDCININSANITELDSLEGVGTATAQKIIDNRPYSKVEDLLKVSGIGETTYDKFKDKICI